MNIEESKREDGRKKSIDKSVEDKSKKEKVNSRFRSVCEERYSL